jgi:hypothetical protein
MMMLPDKKIHVWGQVCYAREFIACNWARTEPLYNGGGSRKLTEEERELLRSNREQLVARFQHEWELEQKQKEEETMRAFQAETIKSTPESSAGFVEAFLAAAQPKQSTGSEFAPTIPPRLPATRPAPIDYMRPRSKEPMDDPRYRKIRDEKIRDWQRKGINLEAAHHFGSLVANCLRDYDIVCNGNDQDAIRRRRLPPRD